MRIVDVEGASPMVDLVYDEVLQPSFSTDELVLRDETTALLSSGLGVVTAVVDDNGRPVGAAVGEWSPDSGVLLLGYLAVRADLRSSGLGGLLLGEVTGAWQDRFHPTLTLAEMEHPLAHQGQGIHGDPAARLRFYARHGARALDLPYFQPALRPGTHRIYGELLAAVAVGPGSAGRRPGTVDADPVRAYLTEYFMATEGTVPTDQASERLWRAMDRPDGIALLPLTDVKALPLSAPG